LIWPVVASGKREPHLYASNTALSSAVESIASHPQQSPLNAWLCTLHSGVYSPLHFACSNHDSIQAIACVDSFPTVRGYIPEFSQDCVVSIAVMQVSSTDSMNDLLGCEVIDPIHSIRDRICKAFQGNTLQHQSALSSILLILLAKG
jgi:hypothetical protein